MLAEAYWGRGSVYAEMEEFEPALKTSMETPELDYNYGKDEKGNQYCYVTQYYQRRKQKYSISFIAIMLNNYWFFGDELKFDLTK